MSTGTRQPRICVVGACNTDLISYVDRMPALGETLHGKRFQIGFGGKGANQAVMAAKLGADVTMITKLGNDVFGENTIRNFKTLGVSTKHVHMTDKAASGVAPIAVDSAGHNAIIIVMGANDLLTAKEIEAARKDIAKCSALVCQLEIPIGISLKALRVAREEGVMTIFNPAPARPSLPTELYALSDIFCPNERETEMLTGRSVETIDDAEAAARVLLKRGAGTVILTLGSRGALIVDKSGAQHVPARKVKAVDSTGAGDAFVGSLAYFLSRKSPLKEAVKRACAIATMSVLKPGTQTSFPSREEVKGLVR